ncbi:DUF2250 domain-containing protein [Halobacteriales archaeon QS_4_69_31]|nr:MAG: DUF2250 domain-containing protein [Halobacteriales archaeon QS_4_69_31]
MSGDPDWLRPGDVAILEYLIEAGSDYVPLVASNLGLYLGYAERRCAALESHGCIEPVSQEVVYRVTDRGERLVERRRSREDEPAAIDGEGVTSAD